MTDHQMIVVLTAADHAILDQYGAILIECGTNTRYHQMIRARETL